MSGCSASPRNSTRRRGERMKSLNRYRGTGKVSGCAPSYQAARRLSFRNRPRHADVSAKGPAGAPARRCANRDPPGIVKEGPVHERGEHVRLTAALLLTLAVLHALAVEASAQPADPEIQAHRTATPPK